MSLSMRTLQLYFFVYLKHRKYPPSDHPRTSSDPGYSGGIRSYGALFFTKRSTKPELISKMEFPIDLGFSLVDRYIVTALGKIKKQFLSDWEVFKKIQFFFSLRILLESISHLPGERDVPAPRDLGVRYIVGAI